MEVLDYPKLKNGSRGAFVASWQRFLLANYFDLGPAKDDGIFGFLTQNATERLQGRLGLPVTGGVDGNLWEVAVEWDFGRIGGGNSVFVRPRVRMRDVVSTEDDALTAVYKLIGKKGYQLIIDFEVGGGRAYYDRYLISPALPGAYSGITIGIGWDLRFNSPKKFDAVWGKLLEHHYLTNEQYFRLRSWCTQPVSNGKKVEAELADIEIPWHIAHEAFVRETIPRFYALACNTFPSLETAPIEVRAALTSLVFNRGGSLKGSRRKYMREIYLDALEGKWTRVPDNLRAMVVWWLGMSVYRGLYRRRYAEAAHAEAGL